jgi:hypothetical protein
LVGTEPALAKEKNSNVKGAKNSKSLLLVF